MYGMVNQAIEDLAVGLGGPQLWASIVERAGIERPVFAAMEAYDDAVTYRLVEAASATLELSPAQVLEAFGEHWIRYTAEQGYGPMLAAMGTTLPQFLGNLDAMHSRIALGMPALRPPSFTVEVLDEGRITVGYWSDREGLAPMVVGLLKGLGARFGLEVAVTLTGSRDDGADHDEFLLCYGPARGAAAAVSEGSGADAPGSTRA